MTTKEAPSIGDVVTDQARRAGYLAQGLWDATTLVERVEATAGAAGGRRAVVDDHGRSSHSYAELQHDAATFAAWLAQQGVGSGDVVSVQLPNCYPFVVAALGTLRRGAVLNPLLPVYRRKELSHVMEVARPKVICTPHRYRGHDHLSETQEVIGSSGLGVIHVVAGDAVPVGVPQGPLAWFADTLGDPPPRQDPPHREAKSVSELIFTSGTEAVPKAIMHTEQTANFSMRVAYADLEMGPDDVVWMPSPIGHSTGFNYGVRFALYHGLTVVLQDRWDPGLAVELIQRERASYTLASTTFLQDLVQEAERRRVSLDSLARFGCGGAPVPPDLVRRARRRGIGVLRLYGSTEALVATWNRPGDSEAHKEESDGAALSDIEIEIRHPSGRPCSVGTAGEIFVRGPNTCVGFYQDPARTAATFLADGWMATGDLATVDDHGSLTVVGRKKEIIIRGGMNITPREIEELLVGFPEVERAAVVGLPDARLGERACACVVLAPGASLDLETTVGRLRAGGLATYKLPERLEVFHQLPTTASGKIQKFEIVKALVKA